VIIHGRYAIAQGGKRIGEERFRLVGHAIESEVELASAVPVTERIRIALDSARAPSEVEITLSIGDEKTYGRFRADRGAGQLRAFVQPQTGASIERILPLPEDAELGHISPLFSLVTCGRLRLRPGERRDLQIIQLAMPTLLPEPRRQRWRRLPDVELLSSPAGAIVAADYSVTPLEEGREELRLQTNLLGLPLRTRIQTADSVGEYVLVE